MLSWYSLYYYFHTIVGVHIDPYMLSMYFVKEVQLNTRHKNIVDISLIGLFMRHPILPNVHVWVRIEYQNGACSTYNVCCYYRDSIKHTETDLVLFQMFYSFVELTGMVHIIWDEL
jgi:hypothetical protein